MIRRHRNIAKKDDKSTTKKTTKEKTLLFHYAMYALMFILGLIVGKQQNLLVDNKGTTVVDDPSHNNNVPEWARDEHSISLAKAFEVGSGGLTDKSTNHKYQIMYHRYLSPILIRSSKRKFRMLEIGLGCAPGGGMIKNKPGGSTLAWRYLFSSSTIELDLHVMEYDAECATKWEKENPMIATKVHSGDASSTEDLDRVYRDSGGLPFDMIIDDASHLNEHQIFTFLHMIQYVSNGGIYVIEDIHSSCMAWKANTGGGPSSGLRVQGTRGCMETTKGNPTIFSKLVEWQKPLITKHSPFPNVTSIEIGLEAAVITKHY